LGRSRPQILETLRRLTAMNVPAPGITAATHYFEGMKGR
jgi:hypothetical protein